MPLKFNGSPGATSEVSRSTILIKDGVVGTVARRDCTYAFPADGEDDDGAGSKAGVAEVVGRAPATFCRPCDGRLNTGNASVGSRLGDTFVLEAWNSLYSMVRKVHFVNWLSCTCNSARTRHCSYRHRSTSSYVKSISRGTIETLVVLRLSGSLLLRYSGASVNCPSSQRDAARHVDEQYNLRTAMSNTFLSLNEILNLPLISCKIEQHLLLCKHARSHHNQEVLTRESVRK